MTAGIYTDEQLFELGKENYDKVKQINGGEKHAIF